MAKKENKYCSLDKACFNHGQCKGCGWSYPEIERRKKLPFVRLENGLLAKNVGRQYREDHS